MRMCLFWHILIVIKVFALFTKVKGIFLHSLPAQVIDIVVFLYNHLRAVKYFSRFAIPLRRGSSIRNTRRLFFYKVINKHIYFL